MNNSFITWKENLTQWAKTAEKGSRYIYAEHQPCRDKSKARVVRELIEKGYITATSKKVYSTSCRVDKYAKWQAIAIKI